MFSQTRRLEIAAINRSLFVTRRLIIFVSVALAAAPGVASAQVQTVTSPMALPPMAISAPDGAWAIDVNPAALGFLPSWSIDAAYTGASKNVPLSGRGYGISVATPLLFGLAAGLSAETITPTTSAQTQDGAIPRGRGSLGLAWSSGNTFSIGSALRFINAASRSADGIVSLDIAVSVRPNPYWSISLLGKDLSQPRPVSGTPSVPRSGTLAIGLRPTGRDDFTAEVASSLQSRNVGLRGGLFYRVPSVGRLMVTAETPDIDNHFRNFLISAGLAIDWGHVSASFATQIPEGTHSFPGWTIGAHIGGYKPAGVHERCVVEELRVESDSPRPIMRLLGRLDRLRKEPQVRGVLLRMNSDIGMAHAQEIKLAIELLKQANKPVVCHLETGNENAFYACAGADSVTADPAGTLELMGPSSTSLMLGDLLKNVGMHADFVRIGEYKSAPEQFTRSTLTEPARRQKEQFLSDVYQRFLSDIARDRSRKESEISSWVDGGPYSAEQAVSRHIITETIDEADLDDVVERALGKKIMRNDSPSPLLPRRWGNPPRVGILLIDGTIIDGESVDIPLVGMHFTGSTTIIKAIHTLASDPSVRAIVVRVESPGGSALASDQIWRALMKVREKKPVVASFGTVAASGGYYIGAAAQEIWSMPATLTGSIGIFFGKVDFAPLATKIGIGIEQFRRGKRAGADSLWRPFSDDERKALEDQIRIGYNRFLDRVVKGRGHGKTPSDIDKLGRGHTWSGDRALSVGLVDKLGSFSSAIARAKELADLPDDADTVVLPEEPAGLLGMILGNVSGAKAAMPLSKEMKEVIAWAGAVYMLSMDHGSALALMPEISVGP